jgi:hypothetical protein
VSGRVLNSVEEGVEQCQRGCCSVSGRESRTGQGVARTGGLGDADWAVRYRRLGAPMSEDVGAGEGDGRTGRGRGLRKCVLRGYQVAAYDASLRAYAAEGPFIDMLGRERSPARRTLTFVSRRRAVERIRQNEPVRVRHALGRAFLATTAQSSSGTVDEPGVHMQYRYLHELREPSPSKNLMFDPHRTR